MNISILKPTAPRFAGLALVLVALVCCGLVASAQSGAKDSLAPKSAGDRWLPCERWVMYHWNPIEMPRLFEQSGISEQELFDWLRDDDGHSFGGLLKQHGLDPQTTVLNALATTADTSPAAKKVLIKR